MTISIYVVENTVNGKRYIGQSVNVDERKSKHLGGSSRCTAISNAVKKYGRDAFSFRVLLTGATKKEADHFEKAMIARLNTHAPNGYNMTEGGEGRASGFHPTPETRKKLSLWQKGKKKPNMKRIWTEEYGRKLSESQIKRFSNPAARLKISDAIKSLMRSEAGIDIRRRISETLKNKT